MASNILKFSLGNGKKIPALALGTWQANDDVKLEKALNKALEVGYRHFDAAFAYNNENIIGRVLNKWIESGQVKREDLFITTKLPPWGMRPNDVEKYLKKSLELLQTDYVDLYLVHTPFGVKELKEFVPFITPEKVEYEMEVNHVEIWKAMEKLVDNNLTRSIGVSNFNENQLRKLLNGCKVKPCNLQIENHIFLQQESLVEFCKNNGIVVTAYSLLGTPGSQQIGTKDVLNNETVLRLSKKYQKSPAQIIIKFTIQKGIVAIPKSVTPERIKENFNVFDFELTDNEVDELKKLNCNKRLLDFEYIFKGVKNHPEYPF